jgi:5-enolpyruvylshikimate-3-phosphate synthase
MKKLQLLAMAMLFAMTGMVAKLICENDLELEETESPRISYPNFADDLNSLL